MHNVVTQDARGGLARWQIQVLCDYIENGLGDGSLRVNDLAAHVNLGASRFHRVFRSSFGFTPVAFILRRRVARAQQLMLEERFPLSRVAADCGFSDHAHFTHVFKRATGETPSEWRRSRFMG